MKKIIMSLLGIVFAISMHAQCEFIDLSVSSSSETQVQLYTPSPFFIPDPEGNVHFWDISDSNGNIIIQEITDSDGNFFLFDHAVPITDTIIACLTITNEVAGPGISCMICDSLVWGGSIIEWEFLNGNNTGTVDATQPPVPNYFLTGQSAPCPPRIIVFQNFTWGSSEILWTFPGGDPATSTSNNPLVTYNSPGDYSFTIEVSNNAGSNAFTSTDEITVFPNPVADFDFTSSGLTVMFENLSEADLPGQTPEYSWDFGDATGSEEENPMHTYAQEGSYEVTLSITNQCGTSTISYEVSVNITGVQEFDALTSLEVLPNPNNGQFEVVIAGQRNPKVRLRLTNVLGQTIVDRSESMSNGSCSVGMNMEALSPGLYFLDVTAGKTTRSVKVIVE